MSDDHTIETSVSNGPKESPANQHKADVGNNPALTTLYVLGGILSVVGLLIGFFSRDLTMQVIGGQLLNVGALMLVGGLVAHAINWQIGRSGLRR